MSWIIRALSFLRYHQNIEKKQNTILDVQVINGIAYINITNQFKRYPLWKSIDG